MEIKPGQYSDGSLIPTNHSAQTGKIPQVKVNLTEIGELAGTDKDVARLCLERVFREFYQKLKTVIAFLLCAECRIKRVVF